ncbi:MAG: hypothetical protein AAF412_13050 [Pseudomonadota bacterium]
MNRILPFIAGNRKRQKDTLAMPRQADKLALAVYLKRLVRSGESLVQVTGFGLRDQVLTHALIAANVSFEIVGEEGSRTPLRDSLRQITLDRYGLLPADALVYDADVMVLEADDVLSGWHENDLVQYVLDHEVPVDSRDMPGFGKNAA